MQTSSKPIRVTTRILSILLALAFLAGAVTKLIDVQAYAEMTAHLNLPLWLIPIIAVIELTSAVLLAIPKTRFYGAMLVGGTMVGAVASHLLVADFAGLGAPIVLGLMSAFVAYFTMPAWLATRLPNAKPTA